MSCKLIELNQKKYVVFRHIDNITLNPKEYLLNKDNTVMKMTYQNACDLVDKIGLSKDNIEEIKIVSVMEEE